MEPSADRPRIPEDYGVPSDAEGLLPWSYVVERLTESKHYWLSTVTPSGAPHTRPIDGFWLDGRLYFGGGPDVAWVRNLQRNPAACLNLEDAAQAVILHGNVREVRADRALAARLAETSNAKYPDFELSPEDYDGEGVLVFEPEVAFAWKLLYEDATRFRFGAGAREVG